MKFLVLAVLCFQALSQANAAEGVCTCSECLGSMELGIVLDSSSSISLKNFNRAKTFIEDFVSTFQIGPDGTRVSLITYGRDIHKEDAFSLDRYSTKESLLRAIENVTHHHQTYTNTGGAIEFMRTEQLNEENCRPGVHRVAVVITDGNSQRTEFTAEQSFLSRASGISMFAVGVTNNVSEEELYNIAGSRQRVNTVNTYDRLTDITRRLAKETCESSDLKYQERPANE